MSYHQQTFNLLKAISFFCFLVKMFLFRISFHGHGDIWSIFERRGIKPFFNDKHARRDYIKKVQMQLYKSELQLQLKNIEIQKNTKQFESQRL